MAIRSLEPGLENSIHYRSQSDRAVVARTFNPSTWKAEASGSELKASLIYRASARTGSKAREKTVSKTKKVTV